MQQKYLGDGLYIGHDGFNVWLSASDGTVVHDQVALDPSVLSAFMKYAETHKPS